jgi:glycosyltransferase involved in cell wall biosynthesis
MHRLEINYTHITERNLALLRNISIGNSKGDYIAFIDDDEYPVDKWLLLLYRAIGHFRASGVFGPVLPNYQTAPPRWVEEGGLCERTRLKTGSPLDWRDTRTGNVLLRRNIFLDPDNLFDLAFRIGGEDNSLFKKLINKNHNFVWCDEAIVFEEIPASRLRVSYFIKRAQINGFTGYYYSKNERPWTKNLFMLLRSSCAMAFYVALMPACLIRGFHHYVKLLIRLNYHLAVVLTFLGFLRIENRNI